MARVGKRVSGRIRSNPEVSTQGWRTLAQCLGYSTPYMQAPHGLNARVVGKFNINEEDPCGVAQESGPQ